MNTFVAGIAAVMMSSVIGTGSAYPAGLRYEACDGFVSEVSVVSEVDNVSKTNYIFEGRDEADLANKRLVTREDMEYLIDHYVAIHPDSAFKGTAEAFILASNETGLDPIFFFSLAGIESGWGTNTNHKNKNNPYSFGMYGDGIHTGYSLGSDFAEGIVSGAVYIYENYYKNGQTTLYLMNHAGYHSYCGEDSTWEEMIESEMAYCRKLLRER